MSDPAILFVRPDTIKPDDKAVLLAAGVLIVEVENPQDMKFTRAHADLDGDQLLQCAMKALKSSEAATREFGKALIAATQAAHAVKATP